MKRKKGIKEYLLVGIVVLSCLLCVGCGADEKTLFIEAETTTVDSGMEEMDIESTVSGVEQNPVETTQEETEYIIVHVCGAVQTPGVYELEIQSRVMDAVLAAGGFSSEADTEYANLATVLVDGSKVRIPTKEETAHMSQIEKDTSDNGVITMQKQENTGKDDCSMVNINTADLELLCTLPGIGQTRAKSILDYRSEHGPFLKIEDIMLVSGIKESSFQKIKEYITIK